MTTRNKKNAKTKTPEKCWKDWIKDIQRLMIKDLGCRLKRDPKKDKNGDIVGFENSRLVMTAQLVECDFILTVDVEPDNGSLAGLSISRFTGLSTDTDGEVYAHFQNGRVLRWICTDTPDITNPQERTSRELKWHRLHAAPHAPADADVIRREIAPLVDAMNALKENAKAEHDKRSRRGSKNAKGGGAPTKDSKDLIATAVKDVCLRLKEHGCNLGMKRNCELAVENSGLTIKWQGLQVHVKKALGKHKTKKGRV